MGNRRAIDDTELENVVGGAFIFNQDAGTLTYYHDDGSVTVHTILDYDNAWYSSNSWHANNYPEDTILQGLIKKGFVAG